MRAVALWAPEPSCCDRVPPPVVHAALEPLRGAAESAGSTWHHLAPPGTTWLHLAPPGTTCRVWLSRWKAEAYTLLACCATAALGRAARDGGTDYPHSARVLREVLTERRSCSPGPAPVAYANLTGPLGLMSLDTAWARLCGSRLQRCRFGAPRSSPPLPRLPGVRGSGSGLRLALRRRSGFAAYTTGSGAVSSDRANIARPTPTSRIPRLPSPRYDQSGALPEAGAELVTSAVALASASPDCFQSAQGFAVTLARGGVTELLAVEPDGASSVPSWQRHTQLTALASLGPTRRAPGCAAHSGPAAEPLRAPAQWEAGGSAVRSG